MLNYLIVGILETLTGMSEIQKILIKEAIIQSRIGVPQNLGTRIHNIHAVQCCFFRLRHFGHLSHGCIKTPRNSVFNLYLQIF